MQQDSTTTSRSWRLPAKESIMAQPPDPFERPASATLPGPENERLLRYLPTDPQEIGVSHRSMVEALVHLSAARYTITTYLPRLLIRQALNQRATSPWLYRAEGALLFADLSGSTALAERLSALGREGIELVTEFLNHIFTTLIQVIQEYQGDLVSFGGDALLVFFDDEHHTRTAAHAALALQEAMHGYVRTVPGVGSFPMHLHVGIESGPVAFVSAGHPDALYYSVLGPAVNGVAAAEERAAAGEVVTGPCATAALAGIVSGTEVAPGFLRLESAPVLQLRSMPELEEPPTLDNPSGAIHALLDDLDRISPYIPAVLRERILADPQRPQLEADLRPVTVLFAQVIGLEAPVQTLPPEQAAQAVQVYVAAMQEAVEQFGGVVNKLDVADQGMKLVAIFGAPAAYEDHAERAARAALEMQNRLQAVNQRLSELVRYEQQGTGEPESSSDLTSNIKSQPFTYLRQRIGINLGTAFAGNVGSPERKEYTVMGDAVNVGARVMSKTAWDEIWCSEAAARAIEGRMVCESRGALALKGKALPLLLLRLQGERDAPSTELAHGELPLVGRVPELAWLRDHVRAVVNGAGRAVRVVGDAGVGKTRLTAELLAEAGRNGARVIVAACFSYTASAPYAAWSEWLKATCGIVTADDSAERARKLSYHLGQLGPGMEDWAPLLADLVRIDIPDNRLTRGLDPKLRQERRFELLEQLLFAAAESRPLLVLFEDLHWADPISLDLWQRVALKLAGRPVLLIGVHRPTLAIDPSGDAAHILELHELSDAESGNLVTALAGDTTLPGPLLRQIISRAAGNPLFLAELLRVVLDHLHKTGTAAANGGSANFGLEDLPDSLNGLLLSRIDRLEETSRVLLRVASVIGQRVHFGVLHAIQHADQQMLLRQLTRLDAQEITVLERVEPERVHAFRHALLQEVAYQSMLYSRRRELHGRIGAYLERRYANELDNYYSLLAHHYRLSDQRDKAIQYLLLAGHAARAIFANEEAIRDYRWALDTLAEDAGDPRAWDARDALGEVYATIGRYDEALAQHAAILAAPGVTPEAIRRAHARRGNVLEKQGQYAAALEELNQAMVIATSGAPDISSLAIPTISADLGLVYQRRGEYERAISVCEQGLAGMRHDPRAREDELIEARLNSTLGGIYGMRGDYPRAQQHFERSLKARETIDDLPGIVVSHNNLGFLWQLQSEYERAIERYRVAEELARKINLRYALVFGALNTAYAMISLAIYPEAEARCVEALALSRELNDRQNIAQAHNTLGIVFYHTGAYQRALDSYAEALQLYRALGSAYQEANTLMHAASAHAAIGSYTEAATLAQAALERATALNAARLRAECLNVLAEIALGNGDYSSAAEHASEAARLSESIGSKYDSGVARRLLGMIAAAHNDPCETEFEASIAIFASTKDRFELARSRAAYGAALAARNDPSGQTYLKQASETFAIIGAAGELRRLALKGAHNVTARS